VGPRNEDICYATQNRQDAVKALARRCDRFLVVGSANSSNSNRLREIAEQQGVAARLIDGPEDLAQDWFEGCGVVGVTAGASAPESLVRAVVAQLAEWGGALAEEVAGREETVVFALPKRLRRPREDAST
ncbi:MAG TPA: 4-hydroxy-3-methylbut-2-enyl diphosphate reductase, partial [Mycobacterium sp.]